MNRAVMELPKTSAATITGRGQVTLPVAIRKRLDVNLDAMRRPIYDGTS